MEISDVETWGDLGKAILKMTPEQRSMQIQCINPIPSDVAMQEMIQGIAIGTVEAFEFSACRSTHNNKYCPNDVVLLMDSNPHAEDGALLYHWKDDGTEIPQYGPEGPTNPEDQRMKSSPPSTTNHCLTIVSRRCSDSNKQQ